MYDKLDFIQSKYEELSLKVSDPGRHRRSGGVAEAMRRKSARWKPIVQKYAEYKKVTESIREAKDILSDGGLGRGNA